MVAYLWLRGFSAALLQVTLLGAPFVPAAARAANCPDTFEKWDRWRTDTVRNANRPEDYGTSAKLIEDCMGTSSLLQDPTLMACMAPLRKAQKFMNLYSQSEASGDFKPITTLIPNNPNELGPDDQKDLAELDPAYSPQAISDLLRNTDPKSTVTEGQIQGVLNRLPKNSKGITFESNTTGNSMIFVTRTAAEDRFVHLEFHGTERFILAMNMQRKDKNGKDLPVPRPFYNTYSLKGSGADLQLVQTPNLAVANCLMCHRTGIMPIALKDGGYQKLFGGAPGNPADPVAWFDHTLAPTTADSKMKGFDTKNMGPGIGVLAPASRTDQFMKDCSAKAGLNLSKERLDRVTSAMNCAACHDGDGIGRISYPFKAIGIFPSLLDSMITSGAMPPHAREEKDKDSYLSLTERSVLLACLKAEYFGGFQDSSLGGAATPGTYMNDLLSVACPKNSGTPQSHTDRGGNKDVPSGVTGGSGNGTPSSSGLAQ